MALTQATLAWSKIDSGSTGVIGYKLAANS